MADIFRLGNREFTSRFILGSGKFSLPLVRAVTAQGGAEMITLALRRANPPQRVSDAPGTPGRQDLWQFDKSKRGENSQGD